MSDCSMSCSTTANQLHVRRTRYNIVSPSLPVNNARSHRSVSAHGSSSNNRPIARGNEVVTSSLNYKRTPHSEVHVRVSFRASLFSLWRLNIQTSIIDGDLHTGGRQPEWHFTQGEGRQRDRCGDSNREEGVTLRFLSLVTGYCDTQILRIYLEKPTRNSKLRSSSQLVRCNRAW